MVRTGQRRRCGMGTASEIDEVRRLFMKREEAEKKVSVINEQIAEVLGVSKKQKRKQNSMSGNDMRELCKVG